MNHTDCYINETRLQYVTSVAAYFFFAILSAAQLVVFKPYRAEKQ